MKRFFPYSTYYHIILRGGLSRFPKNQDLAEFNLLFLSLRKSITQYLIFFILFFCNASRCTVMSFNKSATTRYSFAFYICAKTNRIITDFLQCLHSAPHICSILTEINYGNSLFFRIAHGIRRSPRIAHTIGKHRIRTVYHIPIARKITPVAVFLKQHRRFTAPTDRLAVKRFILRGKTFFLPRKRNASVNFQRVLSF